MEARKENWKYFRERFPEIHQAYEKYGQALHESGGPIPEKERWLIKIGVRRLRHTTSPSGRISKRP
jgi:alkylhydroperoxidase/carboxymuconolactone decarboxylase family protein YurZ